MFARGVFVAIALSMAFMTCGGCGKSDSGNSGGSSDSQSAALSRDEKEAADAVLTEVKKHWTRAGAGYVCAYNSGNAFAPNYLRELQDIAPRGVESRELTAADKANGVQWAGSINFKKALSREAGESGIVMADWGNNVTRTKGRWSQWVDLTPESIRAQKANGKWQFEQQTMLLVGTQPTPGDFQNAKVQP